MFFVIKFIPQIENDIMWWRFDTFCRLMINGESIASFLLLHPPFSPPLQYGAFIFTSWPSSLPLLREAPPLSVSPSNHRAPVSAAGEADWSVVRLWNSLPHWSCGASFPNSRSPLAVLPSLRQSGWWVGGASGGIQLCGLCSDWLCSSAALWGRLRLSARRGLSERPGPSWSSMLRPHSPAGNSGKRRCSDWPAAHCSSSCVCVCCHTLPGECGGLPEHSVSSLLFTLKASAISWRL